MVVSLVRTLPPGGAALVVWPETLSRIPWLIIVINRLGDPPFPTAVTAMVTPAAPAVRVTVAQTAPPSKSESLSGSCHSPADRDWLTGRLGLGPCRRRPPCPARAGHPATGTGTPPPGPVTGTPPPGPVRPRVRDRGSSCSVTASARLGLGGRCSESAASPGCQRSRSVLGAARAYRQCRDDLLLSGRRTGVQWFKLLRAVAGHGLTVTVPVGPSLSAGLPGGRPGHASAAGRLLLK